MRCQEGCLLRFSAAPNFFLSVFLFAFGFLLDTAGYMNGSLTRHFYSVSCGLWASFSGATTGLQSTVVAATAAAAGVFLPSEAS